MSRKLVYKNVKKTKTFDFEETHCTVRILADCCRNLAYWFKSNPHWLKHTFLRGFAVLLCLVAVMKV